MEVTVDDALEALPITHQYVVSHDPVPKPLTVSRRGHSSFEACNRLAQDVTRACAVAADLQETDGTQIMIIVRLRRHHTKDEFVERSRPCSVSETVIRIPRPTRDVRILAEPGQVRFSGANAGFVHSAPVRSNRQEEICAGVGGIDDRDLL